MKRKPKLDVHPNLTAAKARGLELHERNAKLRAKLFEAIPHFENTIPKNTPLVIVSGVRGAGVCYASNLPRAEIVLMLRELLEHLEGTRQRGVTS